MSERICTCCAPGDPNKCSQPRLMALSRAIEEAETAHKKGMDEHNGMAKLHVNCLGVLLSALKAFGGGE